MTPKAKKIPPGYLDKAECSNISCPRDRQEQRGELPLNEEERFPLALPKHDMSKDANGNYWCQSPQCQQRYALIQWGAAHNWPAVSVGRSSILDEWECWKVAIMLGNDDAIECYYDALILPVDETDDVESA